MQKGQSNYEKIALIVAAVLALAGGGWFIYASMGFGSTVERPPLAPRPLSWDVPIKNIEAATSLAASDSKSWNQPVKNNKPVPLFKSVLLISKNDAPEQAIDMFTEDVQIRPPMTNKWLRENNLPYLIPNVGDLDADKDGFSNLEEFNGKTNPNDRLRRPPVTDKLFLVQRIEHKYLITLKSSGEPPFQVSVTTEDPNNAAKVIKKGYFTNPGAVDSTGKSDIKATHFGVGDRFEAKKFEKKVVPDPRTGEKDLSELTVYDTVRKNEFVLVKDVETNLADYEAVFESRLGVLEEIKARKGDTFKIPSQGDTTYKVIDIKEDSAVISPLKSDGTPEKEIVIKKG